MFKDIFTCRKLFEDAAKAGSRIVVHYVSGGPRERTVTPLRWDRLVKMKREDGATWSIPETAIFNVVPALSS